MPDRVRRHLRRRLRRRAVARERLHPRRPQRDRPGVRHLRRQPGHPDRPADPAHELHPGDRRQDRRLQAGVRPRHGRRAQHGHQAPGRTSSTARSSRNFTPRFLVQPTGSRPAPPARPWRGARSPSEGAYDLDFGFEVGGPIMKDKLWFYAGFAPVITEKRDERFLRSNVFASRGAAPSAIRPSRAWTPTAAASTRAATTCRTGSPARTRSSRPAAPPTRSPASSPTCSTRTTTSRSRPSGCRARPTQFSMNGGDTRRTWDTDDNIYRRDRPLRRQVPRQAAHPRGGRPAGTTSPPPRTTSRPTYQKNTPTFSSSRTPTRPDSSPKRGGDLPRRRHGSAPLPGVRLPHRRPRLPQRPQTNRLAGRVSTSYLLDAAGSHNTKVRPRPRALHLPHQQASTAATSTTASSPSIAAHRSVYPRLRPDHRPHQVGGFVPPDPDGSSPTSRQHLVSDQHRGLPAGRLAASRSPTSR